MQSSKTDFITCLLKTPAYGSSSGRRPLNPTQKLLHNYVEGSLCGSIDCGSTLKESIKSIKEPYHLDNRSPQVSSIFSAHSLETSPDPLSNGSSLSKRRGRISAIGYWPFPSYMLHVSQTSSCGSIWSCLYTSYNIFTICNKCRLYII